MVRVYVLEIPLTCWLRSIPRTYKIFLYRTVLPPYRGYAILAHAALISREDTCAPPPSSSTTPHLLPLQVVSEVIVTDVQQLSPLVKGFTLHASNKELSFKPGQW